MWKPRSLDLRYGPLLFQSLRSSASVDGHDASCPLARYCRSAYKGIGMFEVDMEVSVQSLRDSAIASAYLVE